MPKTKIDRYPLFSVPVKIEKEIEGGAGKYSVYFVDPEVQVNAGMIEPILGEDLYYRLLEELGQYEMEEKLTLPITEPAIFTEIWHKIKAQLKLKEANFNEESFSLDEMRIALSPRANYFLAEDLQKLSKLNEEELEGTALTSWISDEELNTEGETPEEKDLYFPFLYDKYQLRVLSLLSDKAAIVQGPPGTGKSETISNLLCHLAATGKRVLFVSQKAQALKVVKDKLKKLGVKYLSGYIPNPASLQISEEDEIDGIAPQLTALNSHIEKLGYKFYVRRGLFEHREDDNLNSRPDISEIVQEKNKLKESLSNYVEAQRKYYSLQEELKRLKDCDITISDISCFGKNFSLLEWQEIKKIQMEIINLSEQIKQYETVKERRMFDKLFESISFCNNHYSEAVQLLHKDLTNTWGRVEYLQDQSKILAEKINEYQKIVKKKNFDNLFSGLNIAENNYTNDIQLLKNDVDATAHDRHHKLLRKLNNFRRNIRLRNLRIRIPREIIDYIDETLQQDISRNEASSKLDSLFQYFLHFGHIKELEQKRAEILHIMEEKLKKYADKLCKEVNELIKERIFKVDTEKQEVDKLLESLYRHCKYYEDIKQLEITKNNLETNLNTCGVSEKEFNIIDDLVSEVQTTELGEIKNNILRVQEIRKEIRELSKTPNPNTYSGRLKNLEITRSEQVALYIQNIINKNIIEKWKEGITIKQIVAKFSKAFGKSKKAFKTFDNLRKEPERFLALMDLIPVWIMELDDASRIIPLEPGIFDYVILDEASQCNVAYTLPVMFRAKKTLFVGDSEQMRDSTIIFKSNKSFDELAHRYSIPEELQIKATGSAVQSVLDIAALRGFLSVPLRYHYRSPAELIGFSNKYFYIPKGKELIPLNNNYLTYEDTSRIMIVHEVESNREEEFSDKVNVAEAKEILKLFKTLRSDKRYEDKSVGILSFFNVQAAYIRKLFEEEGFKEEEDNYKVSIIEGIQGDEKDIIIYSFVIRSPEQKNKYVPLSGEGGDILADINRGRVNVAFSRARLQVHCFTSLSFSEMPEKIWLKKYLEYIRDNGKIDFYSVELKPFDSNFEKEFYKFIKSNLPRSYCIQNQVKSCGFKIDFVITNTKTGKKIAVECDGPTHFRDEIDEAYDIYVENDEERQRVLETAGWKFYRLKYSDWLDERFDRNTVVKTISELLK